MVGGRGGGYYEGPDETDITNADLKVKCLGGFGGTSWKITHRGGDGGAGGRGGIVTVDSTAKVYAFNGNKYSDGTSTDNKLDQAAIYLQANVALKHYKVTALSSYDAGSADIYPTLEEENVGTIDSTVSGYSNKYYDTEDVSILSKKLKTFNTVLTNVDMSLQGVGSGAGYVEYSNGKYTVN